MVLSHIYQTLAHSTGLSFQNAVAAQQQVMLASGTSGVQGTSLILNLDVAESSAQTARVDTSEVPDVDGVFALLRVVLGLSKSSRK